MDRQDLIDPRESQHRGDLGFRSTDREITPTGTAHHNPGEQHSDTDGIEEVHAEQVDHHERRTAGLMHRSEQLGSGTGGSREVEITDQTHDRDGAGLRDHQFDAHGIRCGARRGIARQYLPP